jgi:hypothetical protein
VNQASIEQFVMRYLETTGCHIAERGEGHVTVKLSPEADKDLMNRAYYWGFVERTGAAPEPMSFTFVFDQEAWSNSGQTGAGQPPRQPGSAAGTSTLAPAPGGNSSSDVAGSVLKGNASPSAAAAGEASTTGVALPTADSILGRYFGATPTVYSGYGRIPNDVMTFGSRRLEQLFGVVQTRGRFIRMFEQPDPARQNPYASLGYSTWLCVNYKLEFVCDMKRDELHSLGINLATGMIAEGFFERIKRRSLTPQIPPNVHLEPTSIRLEQAVAILENHLETMVKTYDHTWSEEAWKRLKEEWSRIDDYYGELLQYAEPAQKKEIEEQYRSREQEIDWQYRPRILVSVTNCGFFHLGQGIRTAIDASR